MILNNLLKLKINYFIILFFYSLSRDVPSECRGRYTTSNSNCGWQFRVTTTKALLSSEWPLSRSSAHRTSPTFLTCSQGRTQHVAWGVWREKISLAVTSESFSHFTKGRGRLSAQRSHGYETVFPSIIQNVSRTDLNCQVQ